MKSKVKSLMAVVLLVVAGFAVSACSSDDDSVSESDANVKLTETVWRCYGIKDGSHSLREITYQDDSSFYLTFKEDMTFEGTSSRNDLTGSYRVNGQELEILSLIQTLVMETEDGEIYLNGLRQVNRFKISGDKLILYYNEDGYLLYKKR